MQNERQGSVQNGGQGSVQDERQGSVQNGGQGSKQNERHGEDAMQSRVVGTVTFISCHTLQTVETVMGEQSVETVVGNSTCFENGLVAPGKKPSEEISQTRETTPGLQVASMKKRLKLSRSPNVMKSFACVGTGRPLNMKTKLPSSNNASSRRMSTQEKTNQRRSRAPETTSPTDRTDLPDPVKSIENKKSMEMISLSRNTFVETTCLLKEELTENQSEHEWPLTKQKMRKKKSVENKGERKSRSETRDGGSMSRNGTKIGGSFYYKKKKKIRVSETDEYAKVGEDADDSRRPSRSGVALSVSSCDFSNNLTSDCGTLAVDVTEAHSQVDMVRSIHHFETEVTVFHEKEDLRDSIAKFITCLFFSEIDNYVMEHKYSIPSTECFNTATDYTRQMINMIVGWTMWVTQDEQCLDHESSRDGFWASVNK